MEESLFLPNYEFTARHGDKISDHNELYRQFANSRNSKEPFEPYREEVKRKAREMTNRRCECIKCSWTRDNNCAHIIHQPVVGNNDVKEFVDHLLRSITLFNVALEKVVSVLVIKLDTSEFFIALLNEELDVPTLHAVGRKVVDAFYHERNSIQRTIVLPTEPVDADKESDKTEKNAKPDKLDAGSEKVKKEAGLETGRRFKIALSFTGEHREGCVEVIADRLANEFSKDVILYDRYHRSEFSMPELAEHLTNLYKNESDLIAIFACENYENKNWCKLEWRAIKSVLTEVIKDNPARIFLFSFDGTLPSGLYGTIDGYAPIEKSDESINEAVADLLSRYAHLSKSVFK
jgi:hypothetical protein